MKHVVLLTIAGIAGLVVAAAQAQDNRPDPDSPAGVEYQLPLERAREEAGADRKAGSRSGDASAAGRPGGAPLFGIGVGAAGESTGSSSNPAVPNSPKDGSIGEQGAAKRRSSVAASAAAGSDSGLPDTPIIALGVLLVGGAAGLALRRVWQ